MYFDGHYHAVLILRQPGSHTFEGMIHNLTKTDFLNYQITVNLEPLDTYKIIQEEETEQQNLQKQAGVDTVVSQTRLDTIRRKQATITKLGEGQTRLFRTTFVVRAWNADETKLAADVSALKAGILSMRNARCYDAHLESTALEVFYSTLPGNSFHPYAARAFRLEDEHVANLIPFSASFTGDLEQAQALFLSSDRALAGFRFHVNGLVQHTGVAGGTRSGKSAKYNNLLYQTGPYFDFDVLVEEGGSHTNYAEDHGCHPIVIQKSGNITINYLDTLGAPLDPDHLAYAISLTVAFRGQDRGRAPEQPAEGVPVLLPGNPIPRGPGGLGAPEFGKEPAGAPGGVRDPQVAWGAHDRGRHVFRRLHCRSRPGPGATTRKSWSSSPESPRRKSPISKKAMKRRIWPSATCSPTSNRRSIPGTRSWRSFCGCVRARNTTGRRSPNWRP